MNFSAEGKKEEGGTAYSNFIKHIIEIKNALMEPLAYRTLLFFLLTGFIIPNYSDMWYYFQINILYISNFTQSLLTLLGYITLFLGTLIFKYFFEHRETRQLLSFFFIVSFISLILSLFLAMRWTVALGINDLVFLIASGVVTETFGLAFS